MKKKSSIFFFFLTEGKLRFKQRINHKICQNGKKNVQIKNVYSCWKHSCAFLNESVKREMDFKNVEKCKCGHAKAKYGCWFLFLINLKRKIEKQWKNGRQMEISIEKNNHWNENEHYYDWTQECNIFFSL